MTATRHYVLLFVLYIGEFFAALGAWFAILFTDEYPPFPLSP
jgi:hypothetical protein